jgi:hypothetical protein
MQTTQNMPQLAVDRASPKKLAPQRSSFALKLPELPLQVTTPTEPVIEVETVLTKSPTSVSKRRKSVRNSIFLTSIKGYQNRIWPGHYTEQNL